MEILKIEFMSSSSAPSSKSLKSPGDDDAAASNVMISITRLKQKLGIPEYGDYDARPSVAIG